MLSFWLMHSGEAHANSNEHSLDSMATSLANVAHSLPITQSLDAVYSLQEAQQIIGHQGLSATLEAAKENLTRASEELCIASLALRDYLSRTGLPNALASPANQTSMVGLRQRQGLTPGSHHIRDESLYRRQALIGTHANAMGAAEFCSLLNGGGGAIMAGKLSAEYQELPELDREEVEHRMSLLRAYEPLAPVLNVILGGTAPLPRSARKIADTAASKVYSYRDSSGQQFALKVPRQPRNIRPADIESEVSAILRLQDNPRFVKLAAVSYTDLVIATHFLPYPPVVDMSPQQLANIKDEHLTQLIEDLLWARRQRALPDTVGDNLLYDPVDGFYIIDPFGVSFKDKGDEDTQRMLAVAAKQLGDLNRKRPEELDREQASARLILVQRFAAAAGPYLQPGKNFNYTMQNLRHAALHNKVTD